MQNTILNGGAVTFEHENLKIRVLIPTFPITPCDVIPCQVAKASGVAVPPKLWHHPWLVADEDRVLHMFSHIVLLLYLYIYIYRERERGARDVIIFIVGNGHGDPH